ncbi:MAG: DHA2 family efflux MFS transporter permease subunit [Actinomycetes bacterium]
MSALQDKFEYKWIVAVTFVLGLFLEIMDTTIMNVAIPTLEKQFHASASSMEWVVIGYLLALAVWIPASGWVGDKIGTKKTFLFALFLFTAASALCGQSHSLGQLIFCRLLQGVGGGMLVPVGTAMLYRSFPPAERVRASTILIVPTVVAPALGPIIGGAIVDNLSWRWIFYVNLPIGVFGFIFGALFLKEHREPQAGKFDAPGFVLSGVGLAGILYALSQGPSHGWLSTPVLLTGLGGIILFALLVKVELTVKEPMLALRLYKDRIFRNANITNTMAYGSFAAFLFLLPQMLQGVFHLSALGSGLTTLPQACGVILMSQIVGRLYHTVGPRRLVTCGLLVASIASLPFAFIGLGTSMWTIRALMFARGCGASFSFVGLQVSTYSNIEARDTGRASSIFSAQRQTSAALGVAIFATIFISRLNHALHTSSAPKAALTGYHAAFLGSVVVTLIGSVYAYFNIHDEDAAATMRPRPKKSKTPQTA